MIDPSPWQRKYDSERLDNDTASDTRPRALQRGGLGEAVPDTPDPLPLCSMSWRLCKGGGNEFGRADSYAACASWNHRSSRRYLFRDLSVRDGDRASCASS